MTLSVPSEYNFLTDDASETLSDLGIKVANQAKNSMLIKIKDSTNTVDEYESHRLKVRIEIYKNQQRYRKVTLKQTITSSKGDTQKVDATIRKLVRKGTIALMSKIDLEEYFK